MSQWLDNKMDFGLTTLDYISLHFGPRMHWFVNFKSVKCSQNGKAWFLVLWFEKLGEKVWEWKYRLNCFPCHFKSWFLVLWVGGGRLHNEEKGLKNWCACSFFNAGKRAQFISFSPKKQTTKKNTLLSGRVSMLTSSLTDTQWRRNNPFLVPDFILSKWNQGKRLYLIAGEFQITAFKRDEKVFQKSSL